MQILFYGLLILSGILGIGVGGLGGLLGYTLKSSYLNTDQAWGWAIILFSMFYSTHPALIYWLYTHTHETLALWLSVFLILVSGVLLVLLPTAIEAGARP
jgi:hypothetical protein